MNTIKQTDFGTKESKSEDMVSIEIDGKALSVKSGTSVMRAARESGIDVPKLCATDSLKSFGSCRLCVV